MPAILVVVAPVALQVSEMRCAAFATTLTTRELAHVVMS